MRFRIALLLSLLCTPVFAQVTPGTSPLTIPRGGTGGATAAAARIALGLAIGTNVEAWDADLDCIAAISATGIIKKTGSGTCSAGAAAAADLTNGTTGTGAVVLAAGPTFTGTITAAIANFSGVVNFTGGLHVGGVTENFPASGNLLGTTDTQTVTGKTFNCASNTCTVRLASDITGFGTGVPAALGVAIGSAGAPVLFNGAGGTPSSITLTNATGYPAATTSLLGIVKPDGTTITISGGVITASGASASAITPLTTTITGATAGNVLTATSTGCSATTPCLAQQSFNSLMSTGQIVNSATSVLSTYTTVTATIPVNNTIPVITQGTEIISVTITPKNTTDRLRVRFNMVGSPGAADNPIVLAFLNSTTNAIAAAAFTASSAFLTAYPLVTEFVPGSTSPQTIHIRVGTGSGASLFINGNAGGQIFGGVMQTTLLVEEIVN
jgi:hypothetical protein